MPFPDQLILEEQVNSRLQLAVDTLMENLRNTADTRNMRFRHDHLTIECIIPKLSKSLIDNIDLYVAEIFKFTGEETDFLINYDIKYRMGGVDDDS